MRYDEYKDSQTPWMGTVPNHWALERTKWSFTLRNERGNETPVLLAATQKHGMYPQDLIQGVVKVAEGTDVQQFRTVHRGDFVISLRSFQGGFERSDYEGVCSPAYQVFYANDRWDTNYLKYLFKNELFIDAMNALTVGIREGRNIKYEDFANSVLAIPPISEQNAIADFLDKKVAHIDSVIAEAKASIDEYKEWKTSVINECTKVTLPSCKKAKLRNFCSFHNGDRSKGYPSPDEFVDEGIPFLGADSLNGMFVDTRIARFITQEKYDGMAGLKIQKYDILYTLRGSTIGKNAMAMFNDGTVALSLMGIRVVNIDLCIPEFLLYWLNSYEEYWQRDTCINGSTAPNLSAEDVKNFAIYLPPVHIQREIVATLNKQISTIDSLIEEKQSLINDLEAYKKSLIFEIVTGKRRVC